MRKYFSLKVVAIMFFLIVIITPSCGNKNEETPDPAKGSEWNSMIWDIGKWE